MPKCGPPAELYRDMRLINGKLPPLTKAPRPKTQPNAVTTPKYPKSVATRNEKQATKPTTPKQDAVKAKLCKEEDKGSKCSCGSYKISQKLHMRRNLFWDHFLWDI